MYERILVPLDGSAIAAQALPLAIAIASAHHSVLTLLHVLEQPKGSAVINPETILATELQTLSAQGVPAECKVRYGKPAVAIIECALQESHDLIVMATHGRSGLTRVVFGSVTDAVVRQCKVPVLVVRATEQPVRPRPRIRRILVPLDGTPLAEAAIAFAAEIAKPTGADIVLFSIWDTFGYELSIYPQDELEAEMHEKHATAKQYLINQTEKLTTQGISARWQLKSGLVVESIISTAQRHDADLIVMATHARHGLERLLEGTVAGEVLRGTTIPVMFIRANESELAATAV